MIGVFDSGLGGLTVVREIFRALPGYGVVYFGDTARTPYGTKSKATVERFALQDARFLRAHGAEVVVAACNTASALATDVLRVGMDVPVFEVVTPAVDQAVAMTKGKIGVIGTYGTVKSGVYERLIEREAPKAEVIAAPCPLFVPLVEEGWHDGEVTRRVAEQYLAPLREAGIDTLILGCTHYPFLRDVIADVLGDGITLIDPARETAERLHAFMQVEPAIAKRCRTRREHRFFASDRADRFAEVAARWLGTKVSLTETHLE